MIRGALVTPGASGVEQPSAALRLIARADRDAITPAHRAAATAAASIHVLDALADLPAGAIVALYAAIQSELATDAIARTAQARGLVVAYPRVIDDERRLAFHLAAPSDLRPGRFRIPEPAPAAPRVEAADMAAIVVPGLRFDRQGHRLGWGRGHYDATLPWAGSALRIGLGFEQQLVEVLAVQPHDCPVHLIATEVALYPGAPRVHADSEHARKGSPP